MTGVRTFALPTWRARRPRRLWSPARSGRRVRRSRRARQLGDPGFLRRVGRSGWPGWAGPLRPGITGARGAVHPGQREPVGGGRRLRRTGWRRRPPGDPRSGVGIRMSGRQRRGGRQIAGDIPNVTLEGISVHAGSGQGDVGKAPVTTGGGGPVRLRQFGRRGLRIGRREGREPPLPGEDSASARLRRCFLRRRPVRQLGRRDGRGGSWRLSGRRMHLTNRANRADRHGGPDGRRSGSRGCLQEDRDEHRRTHRQGRDHQRHAEPAARSRSPTRADPASPPHHARPGRDRSQGLREASRTGQQPGVRPRPAKGLRFLGKEDGLPRRDQAGLLRPPAAGRAAFEVPLEKALVSGADGRTHPLGQRFPRSATWTYQDAHETSPIGSLRLPEL